MIPEQVVALRAAVIQAGLKHGTFVEFLDDDDTQHVVTGVTEKNGEMVASLASGGLVALADEEIAACNFRLVTPAIPPECPGRDCERCPLQPVCPDWKPRDERANYFHGILSGGDAPPGYERKPLPTTDARQ